MKIGELRGHARPTAALRRRLGILGLRNSSIERILDEETGVDALSRLLTEAMQKSQTKDGRVDMKDVAAFVLAEMKRSGS